MTATLSSRVWRWRWTEPAYLLYQTQNRRLESGLARLIGAMQIMLVPQPPSGTTPRQNEGGERWRSTEIREFVAVGSPFVRHYWMAGTPIGRMKRVYRIRSAWIRFLLRPELPESGNFCGYPVFIY
jgi:hypothetical protein